MSGLRDAGRILLVSCYENGHTPHGVAMPMGFLTRDGFRPAAVDLSLDALADNTIDDAQLAIISVPMHTALRLGVVAAERIRARNPACAIGFVGLYATMNRDYLRERADWVLAGEYEADLLALVRAADLGNPRPRSPAATSLTKLSFPAPVRTGLPDLGRYARLITGSERRVTGYAETTRGCLDMCAHCPVPAVYRGRLFAIPCDVVIDDIASQVAAGAQHITFGDPDFLNGPSHGLRVLRELHRRWPALSFDITAQVSHLLRHAERLEELATLGCAFVVTAIESVSDHVLTHLAKRHRVAEVERAVALARGAGLVLRPTFVPFTPWTSLDDIRALFDFIADQRLVHHVSPVQLSIRLLVPPGSLLLENDATRGAFGALDAAALTHRWVHRDQRVDTLQRALAQCATHAAETKQPDTDTFIAMRALVHEALGTCAPTTLIDPMPADVPRLTEPWFC